MGMFDKPKFLTGNEGYVKAGDTFWLHNARIDGVGQQGRPKAKLLVSLTEDGPKEVVYTSGGLITKQVDRMSAQDRSEMPMEVRLDQLPPRAANENPTYIINPASAPVPGTDSWGTAGGDDAAEF